MAKQLQLRKGTATEHNTFTGALGEVTVDTTNKTLRVHDGTTAGGTQLATLTGAVVLNNTLTSTSTTQALTAAQGKVLKDTLDNTAASSLGVGQTWQNVTSSRALGTTYTNSTGKPIQVSVTAELGGVGTSNTHLFVNGGVVILGWQLFSIVVPPLQTYKFETTEYITQWWELR